MVGRRDRSIDIVKAILICSVIIGHTIDSNSVLHRYIYTFHMPVFFIISGYLNVNHPEIDIKTYIVKIIKRYAIPYFSFSCIFIIITGGHLKDIIRMLLGGNLNVTFYSYAYWFINVLMISLVIIKMILFRFGYKVLCGISVILWVIGHIFQVELREISLPWGIEFLMISIPYMSIGILIRYLNWYSLPPLCNIFYIIMCCMGSLLTIIFWTGACSYQYNINMYILGNGVVDFFVPVIAFYTLGGISKIITHFSNFSKCIEYIGQSSMVLFYIHPFLISSLKGSALEYFHSTELIVLICVATGVCVFYVASQNSILKKYILGM